MKSKMSIFSRSGRADWIKLLFFEIMAFLLSIGAVFANSIPYAGFFSGFLFALPLIIGVFYSKSFKETALLALFAYAIELLGVLTGFPYGSFHYSMTMGPLIFGLVPLVLPLTYLPLVFLAAAISSRFSKYKIIIITLFLLLFDLVIDPGAVAGGIWSYSQPGIYYGVPLSNFLGWIFSGSIAAFIMRSKKKYVFSESLSGMILLSFFSGVCIFNGLIVPAILGFSLVVLLNYLLLK